MSQEDSGESDSSDDTETQKGIVSQFLSNNAVNKHWNYFILSRGDIWKYLFPDKKSTGTFILYWEEWFDDLQVAELSRFLKEKAVADGWQEWITSRNDKWQGLAAKMKFNKKTGEMEIAGWNELVLDLQVKEVSRFLVKKKVAVFWREWITSRDDEWQRLADRMKFNKKTLEMEIAGWNGLVLDLQVAEVSRFLEEKKVAPVWQEWIISRDEEWRRLADKMTFNKTGKMKIAGWNKLVLAMSYTDLQVGAKVSRFLEEKEEVVVLREWIISRDDELRRLAVRMTLNKKTGKMKIAGWNKLVLDIRKRLVRRCLEDNVVDTGWQKFIMDNKNVMQQLANSIIGLDQFLYMQQDRSKLYPDRNKVLAAFRYCPFSALKVVLFGEDPRKPQATGLAFSYDEGTIESDQNNLSAVKKIHVVLRRIDPSSPQPPETSCCHVNWAERGVLLLNSALTYTNKDDKDEHKAIWEGFMWELMNALLFVTQELDVLCWSSASRELFPPHQDNQYFLLSTDNPSDPKFRPYYWMCNEYHRIYPGPHPAERAGIFAREVIGALRKINARHRGIFMLEKIDDMGGLTSEFANITVLGEAELNMK